MPFGFAFTCFICLFFLFFFFFFYIRAHMSTPQPLFLKDDSCFGFSQPETEQGETQEGFFFLQQPLRCAKNTKFVQHLHSSLSFPLFHSCLPSNENFPAERQRLVNRIWSRPLSFSWSKLTFPLLFPFLLSKDASVLLFWRRWTCVCWFSWVLQEPSASLL